jgi:hypothetical protein
MPRERFLDVTTATVSPEPGHGVEVGPCGSEDFARHVPYPLQLQLLRTDRRTYRRMERLAVDVRIKNVSSEAVLFPSSPTPIARRDRPLSGYRHAGFEFVLIDAKRGKSAIDLFVLYGSPAIPASLIRLEPGESITFRLPGMLSTSGYQDERNPILYPAPGLQIATEMWLFAPDEERFRCRFDRSANSLPIAIRPTIAAIPEPRDDGRPPVVRDISPQPTSADRVVRVAGYRLGADHSDEVDVVFSNGPLSLKGNVGNSSYEWNDRSNGVQQLFVTVPPNVFPGTWHVTIQQRGTSSAPFPITIGEWPAPRIHLILPMAVTPGEDVILSGANFRVHDVVELTDAHGKLHTVRSSALGDQIDITVPPHVPEGSATIRIRARKDGQDVFSNSQVVRVTRAPVHPLTGARQPGGMDGQFTSAAAPEVDVIRVGPSDQVVVLFDGPDRPAIFNAVQGDPLVLHLSDATPDDVLVTFRGRRRSIQMQSVRQDEYNVRVRLPENMPRGPWRIDVQRKATGQRYQLPITMVVHKRPA